MIKLGKCESQVDETDPTLLVSCRQIFGCCRPNKKDSREIEHNTSTDGSTVKRNGSRLKHQGEDLREEKELILMSSSHA